MKTTPTCIEDCLSAGLDTFNNSTAVRGFETFADAQEFVSEYGGTICLYRKRDGHYHYENRGTADGPLTADDYLADLGDDYFAHSKGEEAERFLEVFGEHIRSGNIDVAVDLLAEYRKLEEAAEDCGDDQTVIRTGLWYVETISNEMMDYHSDVYHHLIGVDMRGVKWEEDDEE